MERFSHAKTVKNILWAIPFEILRVDGLEKIPDAPYTFLFFRKQPHTHFFFFLPDAAPHIFFFANAPNMFLFFVSSPPPLRISNGIALWITITNGDQHYEENMHKNIWDFCQHHLDYNILSPNSKTFCPGTFK